MPTADRTPLRRRLALGAVAVVALIILVALFATGRRAPEPVAPQTPRPVVVNPPPLPLPQPPLNRGALIEAAGRAASAYAGGGPAPEADRELVGQRFRIGIPFGCAGPANDKASDAYWTREGRAGAIRLVARPQDWTKTEWVKALAGDLDYEAAEGFWLPRPWTSSQTCAPGMDGGDGEQTLGLAMFFAPGGSRVLQRSGRPYEHVMNAPGAGQPVAPKGFRLVLTGRIVGYGDGQPIHCRADGPGARPVCLVAVKFEEVSFEDPIGSGTLAEWRSN